MTTKSMIPLGSEDHYGHARGILNLFTDMTTDEISSAWKTSGMALLSAQRHVDALYEICAGVESENHELREQLEQAKNNSHA